MTSFALKHDIGHHWDVFKAALQSEKMRGSAKRYSETEFLPAVLEVMETPPSPMARAMMWSMMFFVFVAIGWSVLGKLDVVAVAPGKIIPQERVKVIQWGGAGGGSEGMAGVVRAIHVSEGQHVKAGQLLVELDATVTGADSAQASRGLLSAEIDRARAQAMTRYLHGQGAAFTAPQNASSEIVATQRSLIESTVAEYAARRASLVQQRQSALAESEAASAEYAKLKETLPLLEKQVSARKELAEQGYGSKLTLWQIQEQLIERKKNISIQASQLVKASAAVATIETQLAQLKQEFAKNSYTGLAKAEDDAALRNQEITKANQRQSLTRITAPVDGTVSQLAVHTIGGVIQTAQPLMTIVPKDSVLIVEAQIQNRDIGFLRRGQPVQVKLEAFPFTDYGLIDGTLLDISADAYAMTENSSLQPAQAMSNQSSYGSAQGSGGLVYAARIKLDPLSVQKFTTNICRARGTRAVPLTTDNPKSADSLMCARTVISPGMAAQAEIKTGDRRIFRYLLSPIAKTTQEAGRER